VQQKCIRIPPVACWIKSAKLEVARILCAMESAQTFRHLGEFIVAHINFGMTRENGPFEQLNRNSNASWSSQMSSPSMPLFTCSSAQGLNHI